MSTKPKIATRASTRTKPTPAPPPPTTRSTRATTSKAATPTPPAPAPKRTARKPLTSRDNTTDASTSASKLSKTVLPRKATKSMVEDDEREPITAYLRIRPHVGEDETEVSPYLLTLSDTSVRMTDPNEPQTGVRYRMSTMTPSSTYKFSHVFPPDISQSEFFTKTTLPLVRDVLQGQNGLLFAYGVTNSGKTYSVQGGAESGSAGILPRSLDVIFNSIEGLHGSGEYRPVRLQGVEPSDKSDSILPSITPGPELAQVLGQHMDPSATDEDIDPTVLTLDRNYEYTIWLSYAEVYNEKIYDLLDNVQDDSTGSIPRSNSGKSLLLTRKALSIKPSPPSDNVDSGISGKYISGLRQFRVHSAAQAKSLVKLGQLHRRVFGTLANRESSRSHGMVFIKVAKVHRGEKDDPSAIQITRLTLVDLAGSERTKHTQTTGERLKEAGNINKSLMVLGQCMEVLRSNQRKLAMSLASEGTDGRMDTRDVKRGLAIVPFRHSKLTEVLMDYFVGDARAVMIVNINPYDTGYDENSHVMRFAALAREVYVTPAPAPIQRLANSKTVGGKQSPAPEKPRRRVTITTGSGKKASEAVLEVLEEDEGDALDSDDDEPINPLVDALFDEVEALRMQASSIKMRCAIIEAEVREEVMAEMEERMEKMEKIYAKRLMKEVTQNEIKTDAKIDMLHQSGLFASPVKRAAPPLPVPRTDDMAEEEDVEMSLIEDDEDSSEDDDLERDGSVSPLAGKGTPQVIRQVLKFVPDPPMLPSDTEDAELTESEQATEDMEEESEAESELGSDVAESEESDADYEGTEDESEDELLISPGKTPRAKAAPTRGYSPTPASRRQSTQAPRISKLAQGMQELKLEEPSSSQASTSQKKKKRQLGTVSMVNVDEIERVAAKEDTGKPVKRMTSRRS
ncbi:unnamed protein product [Mycena citricolor]|uniref:Kinesin motor domain-containing protein n=1 Tax=Mycena citricolor TaxID=2018698 RepID=A0AAD2JVV3_9AGAR|nr:unnamed protein product [Mycena citricolor]